MKASAIFKKFLTLIITISVSACGSGGGGSIDEGTVGGYGGPPMLLGGAIQGTSLSLTNDVTTFAGSPIQYGSADGAGSAARFDSPDGITTDGTNLFVADNCNHTIRKIVISTGEVSTLAGSAGKFGSADGIGAAARFYDPLGITTDGTNLYVADWNNCTIRKIVISTGMVTTLAGSAGVFGSADGIGTAARFVWPQGITTDGTNLYVTDSFGNTIRKIVISNGSVTTLAGNADFQGSLDGIGSGARFNYPTGITTDGINLYVTDSGNYTIRKIVISTGAVTTMAGVAGYYGFADGRGLFKEPTGITSDGTSLYVTDYLDNIIRKVDIATRSVTTIAGTTNTQGYKDGNGPAARFYWPTGITTDGKNLYVVDSENYTIRKIN